jgi:hypothetical protein
MKGPWANTSIPTRLKMREQGYCEAAAESQIRLVADFSRWLAKREIAPQQITGIVAALVTALDLGYLYAGNHASQACRSSCRTVIGVFFRNERRVTRTHTMTSGMR